jgi:uncharacterized protein involved in outer membrane biogenesis
VVPHLGARHATAGLELDGDRATWRFGERSDKESRLQLGLVAIDDGRIRYLEGQDTDLDILVKGSAGEGGELHATGTGRFRGEAAKAEVQVPNLDPQHEAALAIDGKATLGRTHIAAAGSLATDGSSLDLKTFRLEGQTFKDLGKVTGMVLPDSPPYTLEGHLVHEGSAWTYDPFKGKVGDSDLAGSLSYAKEGKRPLLKANLRSKLLDFDDLGPIIGAPPKTGAGETAAPEQRAHAEERAAQQRILPDKHFGVDAWKKMDADVKLDALRVQRPKQLPIDKLSTHLVLQDSVLHLEPLDFGIAQGRITSHIVLDARERPVKGELKADVRGLKLGPLFPTVKAMQDALGTLYGRAELKGHGTSVAELLGTSDGKASLVIEGGRAGAMLMELAELDVANVVMLLGKKREQEELRCAVSGFDVHGGVAQTDSFTIDTEGTVINVNGQVNLAQETLDLAAVPNAKHQSLVSLRTPLHLEGPLRKPKVRPEAGPLVKKGALAVGLGAINPALAVFALYEPAHGKDQPCGELIAEAQRKGAGAAKEPPKEPVHSAQAK